MTNTASETFTTETLTHAELMAKRDGAVRLWVVMPGSSAKLVRDGVSFARIDTLTDDTVWCKLHGTRRQVASWEVATAWLQSILVSEILAYPAAA